MYGALHGYVQRVCVFVCVSAETGQEVPQPEVQVWGGQRRLLREAQDEVLCSLHALHQRRLSAVHL